MASPEFHNNTDTLSNKIEKVLTLWDDSYSPPYCRASSNNKRVSFRDISIAVHINGGFAQNDRHISSHFPFHDKIKASDILLDEELYEAMLYSKVFESSLQFEVNRHKHGEELVWVKVDEDMWLVSPNQLLYIIDAPTLESVRENGRKSWAILRNRVKRNITKEFGKPGSVQDQKGLLSNWRIPPEIPPLYVFPAAGLAVPRISSEVKYLILDELNSISNLDPLLKRQFEFDLTVFANQSIYYWHERLDLMRSCAKTAVPKSAELTPLIETISKLEQVVKQNQAYMASMAEQLKPKPVVDGSKEVESLQMMVSKFERMMKNNESEMLSLADSFKETSAVQLSGMKKLSEAVIASGDSISPAVTKLELIADRIGNEVGALGDTFSSLKKAGQIDGMKKTPSDVKATGESTSPVVQKFDPIAEGNENQVGVLTDTVSTFKKASADQLADMKRLTTAVKAIGDSIKPVVHQLELIAERNENQVGVLVDTVSSLNRAAPSQVADKIPGEADKAGGDTSTAPVEVTLQKASEPVPEISNNQIDDLKEGTKVNADNSSSSDEWCHLPDISAKHDESVLSLPDGAPLDLSDKSEWFYLFEDILLLPETIQRSVEISEPGSADLNQLQNIVISKLRELRDAIRSLRHLIGMV